MILSPRKVPLNLSHDTAPTSHLGMWLHLVQWEWDSYRAREDHIKSDLDQRSRSDKWSRSFYPKDHLKRKDQDLDQDHPKRSLSCTKDGDIYKCDITYFVTLMSSEISFPNYVEMPSFHKLLFYSNSEGPFFGILGMYTKWSRGKIKGKWI